MPLTWLLTQPASVRLKADAASCQTIDDYLELAFSWNFLGLVRIEPSQVREEISELLNLVAALHPKSILEIGTAGGGTLYLFSRIAKANARIVTVDLPKGQFKPDLVALKIPLYRSFALGNQKICVIKGDSHDQRTQKEVGESLGDERIDFLFIDGDHSYTGVRKDFDTYSTLVRNGGLVAFHDIVPHPPETGCEVNLFWREIKVAFPHSEIVKDWNQGWGGIGILHV